MSATLNSPAGPSFADIAAAVAADNEAYELGKRDGYSDAVQWLDEQTGGDGEYRYCMGGDGDRHCPGPVEMRERIVARFNVLTSPSVSL
jgi:hypothetical protein